MAYTTRTISDVKELSHFVGKDDRSRALFVGKAYSKEQISFVAKAGKAGIPLIGTCSKMSVGKAVLSSVKPPAALTFRV